MERITLDLTMKFSARFPDVIKRSIKDLVRNSGKKGVVVGLSGGIDSTVVAKLSADALGKDKVLCVIMPIGDIDHKVAKEAVALARSLKLRHEVIDLSGPFGVMVDRLGCEKDKARKGNLKARLRMLTLYERAARDELLVLGTGNKSELLVGYFTKYGDGGSDFLPIGDLYKTQVRALAAHIGIPEKVIKKVPTAGLWKGQTDEGQLGMLYEDLDRVLFGIEHKMSDEAIAEGTGKPVPEVARIRALVKRNRHKRALPRIPKLGFRTIGIDWNE
jgi:NAD+ synthase